MALPIESIRRGVASAYAAVGVRGLLEVPGAVATDFVTDRDDAAPPTRVAVRARLGTIESAKDESGRVVRKATATIPIAGTAAEPKPGLTLALVDETGAVTKWTIAKVRTSVALYFCEVAA